MRRLVPIAAVTLLALPACGDDSAQGAGGAGGAGGADPSSTTTSVGATTASTTSSTSAGGGEGGAPGEGGGGGGGEPTSLEVTWSSCAYAPEGAGAAECARPEAPLDWDDPDGARIELFVKRVPAVSQPARGQLWLLNGGPGVSVAALEGFYSEAYRAAAPDLDLYLVEHRGVGEATELACEALDPIPASSRPLDPEQVRTLVAECVDDLEATWGDGLAFFDATSAGRDLGELIAATRAEGEEVYVASVSYGTRWAHRYLQQFPDQPTGMVFDSAMDESSNFFLFGVGVESQVKAILDDCGADPICNDRLGGDPWGKLGEVLARVRDEGHCPTSLGLGYADWRAFFAAVGALGPLDAPLVAPMLDRLDRCDADDRAALLDLRAAIQIPGAVAKDLIAAALHFNVVFSEIPGEVPGDIDAIEAGLRVSDEHMLAYAAAFDEWPRYEPGPLHGTTAASDVPLVVLAGTHDGPSSAWGPAFGARFDGENQSLVVVERGHHTVFLSSPLEGGDHCGERIVAQFLAAPGEPLDTSCASEVLPLDFDIPGAWGG